MTRIHASPFAEIAGAIALAIAALTSPAVAGTCSASSGSAQAQVVELYTSEGCSSCPPADRWLSALEPGADLIPLAFHVDYWDYLGWRDPFASADFSERQRELAKRGGSGAVYTPEVAVNGREHRRWARALPDRDQHTAPVQLKLSATTGETVTVTAQLDGAASAVSKHLRVWFALTESGVTSRVAAGENRGKLLRHDHVVRALSGPHAVDSAQASLALGTAVAARSRVVAWVDDTRDKRYLQAVSVALGSCGGS